MWFLVRKVDPYYGKYMGILANVISLSDSRAQLLARTNIVTL
jgi:hypothetical protein